ncbi:MAG: FCD domain-containing protein [Actinomycetota bacterium]|nr:FCD domain-containing protein [Actinomycetota bacterium]
MPIPSATVSRKLASIVSEKIGADIAARGLAEGELVGSEAELLAQYDVSRAVFREAVRLLEHQQSARMRRGPGGGLVVTTPDGESAFNAAMVYLLHGRADLDEVLEVRLVLEASAALLAAERMHAAGIAELNALVQRERKGLQADARDLHGLVARLSGNPALDFFVDLLTRMARVFTPDVAADDTVVRDATCGAHAKIVQSIVSGDGATAATRMERHLRAEADYIAAHLPSSLRLGSVFSAAPADQKLGEHVARAVFADVVASGWRVGASLGSEAELMAHYDVSRAILREAARLLEHHGIASMRRGPGGGLFVAAPAIDATSAAAAVYLDRRGVQARHLFELRSIVEMAVLERVIDRLDQPMIDRLRAVQDVERAASTDRFRVVGHDLHVVLGELSGNRVLALCTDVLVRLSRERGAVPADAPDAELPTTDVVHTHDRIVDAIVARDSEKARARMNRHLNALARWVR